MSRLSHPNVLPLYGICIVDGKKILTPLRKLGSLDKFLRENPEKMSPKILLSICHQIALVSSNPIYNTFFQGTQLFNITRHRPWRSSYQKRPCQELHTTISNGWSHRFRHVQDLRWSRNRRTSKTRIPSVLVGIRMLVNIEFYVQRKNGCLGIWGDCVGDFDLGRDALWRNPTRKSWKMDKIDDQFFGKWWKTCSTTELSRGFVYNFGQM